MLYLFAWHGTYRYLKDTIGDNFYRLSRLKKADKKKRYGGLKQFNYLHCSGSLHTKCHAKQSHVMQSKETWQCHTILC